MRHIYAAILLAASPALPMARLAGNSRDTGLPLHDQEFKTTWTKRHPHGEPRLDLDANLVRNVKQDTDDDTQHHKIIGGVNAAVGEFEFFADFGGCGASLIHGDILLTAGHCSVISFNDAYVGAYKEASTEYGAERHLVTERRVHPDYDDFTLENDVMVLKIQTPSAFTPVALNPDPAIPAVGEDLVTIGHGVTNVDTGAISSILQKVTVPYVSHSQCAADYASFSPVVEDVMLCAGLEEGGKDACQGDSGGPLLQKIGDSYVQVGVTSWGDGCAQANAPGVYARISGVKDWIDQQICQMSDNPPSSCSSMPSEPVPTTTEPPVFPAPTPPDAPTTTPEPTATEPPVPAPTPPDATTPFPTAPIEPTATEPPVFPAPTPPGTPTQPLDGQVSVRVDIVFDYFAYETGWSISQQDNVLISYPAWTYSESGLVSENINLDPGEYNFTMTDIYGDGICCTYGDGNFSIYAELDSGDVLLAESNGQFGSSITLQFVVPSDSISTAPPQDPTTPPGDCQDSDSETFLVNDNEGYQDCAWLVANESTFGYLCKFVDVAFICRETCGICDYLASISHS